MDNLIIYDAVDIFLLAIYEDEKTQMQIVCEIRNFETVKLVRENAILM